VGIDDLAQVIVVLLLVLIGLFRKKPAEEKEPRPHRPAPHVPPREEPPAPSPPPPQRHRPRVAKVPSEPPPSRRLEESRPAHLASTRSGHADLPLSDFAAQRSLDAAAAAAATPAPPATVKHRQGAPEVSLEALRSAVIWREVLGPARAYAPLRFDVRRR
jgi:hypothetical protein